MFQMALSFELAAREVLEEQADGDNAVSNNGL
jgi:hypothetical protein